MVDTGTPPPEHLTDYIEQGHYDNALAVIEGLANAPVDARKEAIRSLRPLAETSTATLEPLLPQLAAFLGDDDRAVRLTTAKLFVTVAERRPEIVLPAVSDLADRLGDDEEFYYVRARAAEALGYLAVDHPDAVASPEVLAELRVGLSFDEPEVKEKLAKALEHVALGNPDRLRHHVSDLAEHLGDEAELVRYHLTTALVVVGCAHPDSLVDEYAVFVERLDDECKYVRGRAVEGLGLLARASEDVSAPLDSLRECSEDEPFVAERARFAIRAFDEEARSCQVPDQIGSIEAIGERTEEIVEDITSPDGDGECPVCGLSLPENGPPMCSGCGAPR